MKSFSFYKITTISNIYFNHAWDLYKSSFPTNEKRTIKEQETIMQKELYTFMACYKYDMFLGIIGFWKIDNYIFIEHFAIDKELRGQNYGSQILNDFFTKYSNIFLEIDPPICDISKRRLNFYKSLGFVENNIHHIQVPFRKNDTPLILEILSLSNPLSQNIYNSIYTKMKLLLINS